MIDFKKLNAEISRTSIINPSEIFMTLSAKKPKYAYLRNVQAEVLDQWFDKRKQKDTIIKMNTGSGKTTVALLILKSCLDEKNGQAAYVVPDSYLVDQVVHEANDLGITVTESEKDISFLRGEAILIINIQKLFNGKSVFGMRSSGNIQLDYVLIDDVHACVDDVKSQFSIKLNSNDKLAKDIFNLYKDDLKRQNEKAFLDIKDGDRTSGSLSVPFWRIADTKSELLSLFQKNKDDPSIKFNYPLIGDILDYCNCTFNFKGVEIEPYAIPIHKITAFYNAERRIFMSATLCDDSQLVSVFDITKTIEVISPKLAADIGDRMILFPQAYSPQITDEDIKMKLLEYSKKYNIVVIVPSNFRAEFWQDVTNEIYTTLNIKQGIQQIKNNDNGLYIFVNKYDGIDLPDDACRIIVLDGVPDARSALDKLYENYLQGSIIGISEKIQKIEQGMGRGIRSSNDYCGVIIMGAALIQVLYTKKACSFFSIATRKQYDVSSFLSSDLKDKNIHDIFSILDYCIKQNKEWVHLSKSSLSTLAYDKELKIDLSIIARRTAFNQAVLLGQNEQAKNTMNEIVNKTDDPIIKGFLMLEEAKYCHFIDPTDAQRILVPAQTYNHHILKPITGIKKYNDIKKIKAQSQQIIEMYIDKDVNEYLVDLNTAVDALIFAPSTFKSFESALMQLGQLLGWGASRPDDEYNIGPDVLWYLGNLRYAIIECKNEAISTTISKDYCGQLLSSISWFNSEYAPDCKYIPIMVHTSNVFDKYASPAEDFRIINKEKLSFLKAKLKEFSLTISTNGTFKDVRSLSKTLASYNFTPETFFDTYSLTFKREIQ